MNIEKATLSDADELAALYDELNDYFSATMNYPGWIKGEYPIRQTAIQGIEEDSLFVLRIDGAIAGTVILNHKPEQAYHQAKWGFESDYSDVIVIHTLAVHPRYLKRGVASSLMDFARQYAIAHKMKAIRLDTSVDNLPAIALYERLGYRYIDTVDLGLNVPGLVWFKLFELEL
jgi:ribosomal protein S18 acetylase RimI-like enzyme